MSIGLITTVDWLEELRERLGADSLRGEWGTGHGVVSIIVPGPRVLVDDQEVPLQEPGA